MVVNPFMHVKKWPEVWPLLIFSEEVGRRCFEKFRKFCRKTPVLKSFLIIINFIKKRL